MSNYDVAIVGAGYVGLPLAATFAEAGSRVLVVDVVQSVVDAMNRGESHIEDVESSRLAPLVEPLGYLDMAALASQARVIVTDSGGLQKEAYWYGIPCVTARPSTEWVDTVELGANVLVDDDPDALVRAVAAAHMPDDRPVLYGDGHASERIAQVLLATMRDR